ncbi:MAG TPA: sigma-70 family RNA polymerase sigma factor [Gemmataceae bacterium]|nr:sigma-70 family RNA polymerase sigma factor [Gemmataceae bacterium]
MPNGLLARTPRSGPCPPVADDPTDAELLHRFALRDDHTAFAALVRRHGPMVFGVCRRVLRDPHDAEEAFQVTFLVLVRKAGVLRQPDRLGNWLYGVANRVARKAKVSAARRNCHEQAAAGAGWVAPARPADGPELRALLDEEMVALPEKYRAPLVLCYLEGLTNEDAARRLGWAPGSMSYRLARGRELLRRRLTRRGLYLALWPVFLQGLTERASAAPVPEPLLEATVERAKHEPKPVVASGHRRLAPVLLLLVLLLGSGAVALAARGIDRPHADDAGTAPPATAGEDPAAEPGDHRCGSH